MDLDFSEEQVMLRDSVRRICENQFDDKAVRSLEADHDKFNRLFWDELGTSGICALRISEAYGGAGMSSLDLAIVFEEFGRTLASSPFLQSCVLASGIIATRGGNAIRSGCLPGLASGKLIVVPAWQEIDQDGAPKSIVIEQDRGIVTGQKVLVPFASIADAFLVRCSIAVGDCWVLVPADAAGISISPMPNYASQPLFAVSFDNVKIDKERIFLASTTQDPVFEADADGLIAAAAEAVGATVRLLALTIDYANQRNQFGRPLAAFQAISHPLADCATELEGVRHLVYQAAWASDTGSECSHLAQMAKLQACSLLRRLATTSIQIHGGIGYSLAGQPQLFYRRSKYHELMNGSADQLKQRIADRILA